MAKKEKIITPRISHSDAGMTFEQLADRIALVNQGLREQAAHAVNCMLTARNWFIGYYIVEFEQHGADRAQYGEELLKRLAKRLNQKGLEWRRLYEFRTFYRVYPQLQSEIVSYFQSQSGGLTSHRNKKLQPVAAILQAAENETTQILRPVAAISSEPWQTTPNRLFHRINYTCLQMLSEIEDPLKRAFYEHELIQGCWTKRQLDRQISTLYYERSALSKDKEALRRHMQQGAETLTPNLVLRDPMTMEFLGIPETEDFADSEEVKTTL